MPVAFARNFLRPMASILNRHAGMHEVLPRFLRRRSAQKLHRPRFRACSGACPPPLHRVRDAVQFVGHVTERQPGMPKQHARTGITHYCSGLIALGSLVTVYRTADAGGLRNSVRAFLQAPGGVGEKGRTSRADGFARMLMVDTVDFDHAFHGFALAFQPAFNQSHGSRIVDMNRCRIDSRQAAPA